MVTTDKAQTATSHDGHRGFTQSAKRSEATSPSTQTDVHKQTTTSKNSKAGGGAGAQHDETRAVKEGR